jgi:hypothetical protein
LNFSKSVELTLNKSGFPFIVLGIKKGKKEKKGKKGGKGGDLSAPART